MVTHPNLVFFYNKTQPPSKKSNLKFGSTYLEVVNGPIKKDNTNLGTFTFQNSIFDIDTVKGLYDGSSIVTFHLPKGSIQVSTIFKTIKNIDGTFLYSQRVPTKTIYKIINGTDNYVNVTGYVVFNVNPEKQFRKVEVYFTENPPKI
jgi:hypothetical protein